MDLLVAISKLVIDALGLIQYNEVLDFISYEVFKMCIIQRMTIVLTAD